MPRIAGPIHGTSFPRDRISSESVRRSIRTGPQISPRWPPSGTTGHCVRGSAYVTDAWNVADASPGNPYLGGRLPPARSPSTDYLSASAFARVLQPNRRRSQKDRIVARGPAATWRSDLPEGRRRSKTNGLQAKIPKACCASLYGLPEVAISARCSGARGHCGASGKRALGGG
jgi:hypothetical protein